jgi:hypothetical protein
MSSEIIPEELKEFLSGRSESDEIDYVHHVAPVYGLSWDKKSKLWIVRVDNKRVMELNSSDFSSEVDIHSYEFVDHILGILKEDGVSGLQLHIEELKCVK